VSALRIAVTGLAAAFPLGGVFWDYIQYLLGLHRLGHDVLYIEDTGKWCYDPISMTYTASGANNAAYLAAQIAKLDPGLRERWFYRDSAGQSYGAGWARVVDFCRSADLFVMISGSCFMREEYFAASRIIFIDSDPVYTQGSFLAALKDSGRNNDPADHEVRARAEMIARTDRFFTFGENIGSPGCLMPKAGLEWIPTRQPIVLDCFQPAIVAQAARRRVLTTVASWEPAEKAPVIEGVTYAGKSAEFERFINLPSISSIPLEVAISGPAPRERLSAAGWRLADGHSVSADPWSYRVYLAHSFGELSVAKNAYVRSRSGWFSGRSACYMALGVPVIVQDTGFAPGSIPAGEGLLTFSNLEEARLAIDALVSAPARHARAAGEIAREYFASDRVLGSLLDQATATSSGPNRPRRDPAG
jgi:hypothetical protein